LQAQGSNTSTYLYYTLKDTNGYTLARAVRGSNGQPTGTPQTLVPLGNEFGLSSSDSVSSISVSPDGRYVAIDGARDHGEQVWMYDTQQGSIGFVPAHVMGNFLHWLPGGNGHSFLYRPMFPLGPDAPMDGGQWNPGLWIVDAATNAHINIDLSVPSADLIDAAPSPDGSRIVYSLSPGLGMGSQVWMMNSDGSARTLLANLPTGAQNGPQSVAGLFSWSPDSTHIAYERLVDSTTPFLPAALWVMNSQGGQAHYLTQTDGGHGYALSWSPDSRKVAYIARTNVGDAHADVLAQSLQCTIGIADVQSSQSWLAVSNQQTGTRMNITPVWTPDSASITFTALNPINSVIGGTPRYWSARISGSTASAHVTPLTPTLAHVIAIGS
jgi:Tol biopolymer transport system component